MEIGRKCRGIGKEMTDTVEEEWLVTRKILKDAATKVCGMTKGGPNTEKEVWWWNKEVQVALKEKKKAYKSLKDGKGDPAEYKRWKKEAKRAVARAKEAAWAE